MVGLLIPKEKGNYGVSLAVVYFLSRGYKVLFPYGDIGRYDLAIEKGKRFQRVQCKYSSIITKRTEAYPVVRLHTHGTRISTGKEIVYHKYTKRDFDLLWVATPYACYLIPAGVIFDSSKPAKLNLKLTPKWDIYRVAIPIPKGHEEKENRVSPRLTHNETILLKRLLQAGKSRKEIAEILDVSLSCIETQIYRNKKFYRTNQNLPTEPGRPRP